MKESLKTRLLKYLKSQPTKWIHKAELGHYAEELGYMNENGTRRIRELVVSGKVEQKEDYTKDGSKTAFYRYVPSQYEIFHQHRLSL